MPERSHVEIDIAPIAIVKVVLTLFALLLLWRVADIIVMLFFVVVVAAAITPIVDKLSRYMPRGLAALLVFLLTLGLVVASFGLLIPPLLLQLKQLADTSGGLSQVLQPLLNRFPADSQAGSLLRSSINQIPTQLQSVLGQFPTIIGNVLSGLSVTLIVIFMTFYLLLEEKGVKKFFFSLVPFDQKQQVVEVLSKMGDKLGDWLRGQLLLMLIVGLADFVGLAIIGVPYALTLGLWAGLTEVVPFLGPFLGAIPAIIIAFTVSPLIALLTIILFALVQQVESNVIVPKVMEKTIGLSPLIIILAILIGDKLLGLTGVVLAVPIAAALSVVVTEWPLISQSIHHVRTRRGRTE